MKRRHIVLAITGASGAIYGLRLGRELIHSGMRLTMLISRAGCAVLEEECGLNWDGSAAEVQLQLRTHFHDMDSQLSYFAENDLSAPVASGSSAPDAMVIAPCSMGTLSRVANGNSGNLLERCADVMLKERRQLVMVPRETPLHEIHLENMLRLSRLGAMIIPAMPAFYHHPQSADDLVDFVVGKVLDNLDISHTLYKRWGK